jgi:putative RNA 2'-phosphotransferase
VAKKYPGFTVDILEEIVATDEKQRYSFNETKTKIRANQGHSIPVDVEFEIPTPPEYLYHGTAEKYTLSIENNGIISKSRLYVHLSDDVTAAINVGSRHGNAAVYRVDTKAMTDAGFIFKRSLNGVWLVERVPTLAIERIM